ncbi:MAG: diaminopimelate epimerase [Ignavibacteria bacterium]|nr:diaminopimelate epimerase [Ignavibacteria bacterium]
MEIEITIMSGAGNIFSVFDNRDTRFPIEFFQKNAKNICKKSYNNYETEGLLVIENSLQGDIDLTLKYFNPDGSFGMMCGNGGRCAVKFALEKNIIKKSEKIKFDVWGKEYTANFVEDNIKIEFPPPISIIQNKEIKLDEIIVKGDFINVNSPHFVIEFTKSQFANMSDFHNFPLEFWAPKIRFHNDFQPDGVNVNIFKFQNHKIYLRTYERGVEKETGACGTGAISTAISLHIKNQSNSNFTIIPTSQEELKVEIFKDNNGNIRGVSLLGNAKILDVTKILLDD